MLKRHVTTKHSGQRKPCKEQNTCSWNVSTLRIDLCRKQGPSQWGATGANAPARLSGAPERPLTHLCGVAISSFLGIHTRAPAVNQTLPKRQGPPIKAQSSSGAPWSELESQIESRWGPLRPPYDGVSRPDAPVLKNPSFFYGRKDSFRI